MPGIARLGDTSNHGGVIISSATITYVDGVKVARVGDYHSCPIPGHGITPIINGSGNYRCEDAITAVIGSSCGCGARISSGSGDSFAPLESPSGAIAFGTPSAIIGGIVG